MASPDEPVAGGGQGTGAVPVERIFIERLADPGDVERTLADLFLQAERQICSALPGGPWSLEFLRSSWDDDVALLDRGIEVKEVTTPAAVNTPAALQYFTELSARGAQIRMSHRVVQRAVLIDRRVAVVPAAVDSHGGAALVVREPSMLLALYQQFDTLWRMASPIGPGAHDVLQVEGVQQVLRLLAEGLTDEAIARRLQLSHRTVQRRVGAVMEMLGCGSRFSAGARAQELGWL